MLIAMLLHFRLLELAPALHLSALKVAILFPAPLQTLRYPAYVMVVCSGPTRKVGAKYGSGLAGENFVDVTN